MYLMFDPGWQQSTTGLGERSSAATGYLTTEVRIRPNLHILVETRVTRILQTSGTHKLALRTVEFTTGSCKQIIYNILSYA